MLIIGFLTGVVIGIVAGCYVAWQDYKRNGVPPITLYKLNNKLYDFKEEEKWKQQTQ